MTKSSVLRCRDVNEARGSEAEAWTLKAEAEAWALEAEAWTLEAKAEAAVSGLKAEARPRGLTSLLENVFQVSAFD